MDIPKIVEYTSPRYGKLGSKLKLLSKKPEIIVLHTTEGSEKPYASRNVAAWFDNPQASANAHYIVDQNQILQYVDDKRISYHAGKMNGFTIGIEICGKAAQKDYQYECSDTDCKPIDSWLDEASVKTLDNLVYLLNKRYSHIPAHHITIDEMVDHLLGKSVAKGYIGHGEIEQAQLKAKMIARITRTDPGKHFPWQEVLDRLEPVAIV